MTKEIIIPIKCSTVKRINNVFDSITSVLVWIVDPIRWIIAIMLLFYLISEYIPKFVCIKDDDIQQQAGDQHE